MLQREILVFCLTFVLRRGHIFASIEKFGSHYEMSQMNRLWFPQIYLYHFYIPELIRLPNDVETNPGPRIVEPTKPFATPYSQGNVEVFCMANAGTVCGNVSVSTCL